MAARASIQNAASSVNYRLCARLIMNQKVRRVLHPNHANLTTKSATRAAVCVTATPAPACDEFALRVAE